MPIKTTVPEMSSFFIASLTARRAATPATAMLRGSSQLHHVKDDNQDGSQVVTAGVANPRQSVMLRAEAKRAAPAAVRVRGTKGGWEEPSAGDIEAVAFKEGGESVVGEDFFVAKLWVLVNVEGELAQGLGRRRDGGQDCLVNLVGAAVISERDLHRGRPMTVAL